MGKLFIRQDDERQIIEINGMRYAYALFEAWGVGGMSEGELFSILKRDDGVLTIQRMDVTTGGTTGGR